MVRPQLGGEVTQPADVADRPERVVAIASGPAPLWTLEDVRRLTRVLAVSITALVVAWLFASSTTDLAHQEYAVAGAIVATALAIAGFAGWLLAGFRTVRAERAHALPEIDALIARRSLATDRQADPATHGVPVSAQGMTRYHDAGCLMVRGKAWHKVQAADLSALAPCPICLSQDAS